MNDYEIVQAAGTGIAMGNSVQKLKDTADYVTDDIARDGVWKACRHFWMDIAENMQPCVSTGGEGI